MMKRLESLLLGCLLIGGLTLSATANSSGQSAGSDRAQLTEMGVVRSVDPGAAQVEISGAIYQFTSASNVEVGGGPSSLVALAPGMKVEVEYFMAVGDGYREVIFLEQLPDSLEIDEF